MQNEVIIMNKLKHPNILGFYTWFRSRSHLWIVEEYCIGGDLAAALKTDKIMPIPTIKIFGVDIMSGLYELHKNSYIYEDLKPSNILIDEYGKLKLSNFGLSQAISVIKNDIDHERRGTPYYMAPELFLDNGVPSIASDLYSFGCVLYELYTGTTPFQAVPINELLHNVLYKDIDFTLIDNIEEDFLSLLRGLLAKDPQKRIKWEDIFNHPFWDVVLPSSSQYINTPSEPAYQQFIQSKSYIDFYHNNNNNNIVNIERLSHHSMRKLYSSNVEPINNNNKQSNLTPLIDQELSFTIDLENENREINPLSTVVINDNNDKKKTPLLSKINILPPNSELKRHQDKADIDYKQQQNLDQSIYCDSNDLNSLLYHRTDYNVTPLAGNSWLDLPCDCKYNASDTDIQLLSIDEVFDLSYPELESYLTKIFDVLSDDTNLKSKSTVLSYITTSSETPKFANIISSSAIISLLVELLQESPSNFQLQVAYSLGIIFKNSTFISPKIGQKSKIFEVFEQLLLTSETSIQLKRKIFICLGELLYYTITAYIDPAVTAHWIVPESIFTLIYTVSTSINDEGIINIGCKILLNIFNQKVQSPFCKTFLTNEYISFVLSVFQSQSIKLRETGLFTILHMIRFDNTILETFYLPIEIPNTPNTAKTLSPTEIPQAKGQAFVNAEILISLLENKDPHIIQASITVILLTLNDVINNNNTIINLNNNILTKWYSLLPTILINILNNNYNTPVTYGKCLLSISLLFNKKYDILLKLLNMKLLNTMERLSNKEVYPSNYLEKCIEILLTSIMKVFKILFMDLEKRLKSEDTSSSFHSLTIFEIVLMCLSHQYTHKHLLNEEMLVILSNCISLSIKYNGKEKKQIMESLFVCIGSLKSDIHFIKKHYDIIMKSFVPSLTVLFHNSDVNIRALSLSLYSELLPTILSCTKHSDSSYINYIIQSLLPTLNTFFADESPIPLYCIRIISDLIKWSDGIVSVIVKLDMIPTIMRYLKDIQIDSATESTVTLICILINKSDIDVIELIKYDVINFLCCKLDYCVGTTQIDLSVMIVDSLYDLLYSYLDYIKTPENVDPELDMKLNILPNTVPSLLEVVTNIQYPESRASHCLLIITQKYEIYNILKQTRNQTSIIHALEVRTERTLQRLLHILLVSFQNTKEFQADDWKKTDLKGILGTVTFQ